MMIPVKGIVVCVGYDDLLAITLPRNARHLTEILVVTSPDDARTREVVAGVPSARCFVTDEFTRSGARFNKGAAIEQGFEALGRDGWILIHDADTLLPDAVPFDGLDPAKLYGAKRRLFNEARAWSPSFRAWQDLPLSQETGWPGYFQLFNGACARVATRPWYDVQYRHAGGGDGYFQSRWPMNEKVWLPIEVLHLGPRDTNWFGRVSDRIDDEPILDAEESAGEMERLLRRNGWGGRLRTGKPFQEKI